MSSLFVFVLLSASIRRGSCTPTRVILDGNTRELPAPLTSWYLWDTDGGLFSPRIPQFDMYRPGKAQGRNFGYYPLGRMRAERLPMGFLNGRQPTRLLETRCENLEDLKRQDFFMSSGTPIRCRRTIRQWTMQEPLYVEEPRWIPLDVKGDFNEEPGFNEEDPFILARGRRSTDKNQSNSSRAKREIHQSANMIEDTDDRMKNFYRELERYLAGRSGYVQPRNKHSDIMDILNEPFFISRGKKSRSKKNDLQRAVDSDVHLQSSPGSYRPVRDRRGEIVEQLLKEQDPFYIARGKKSTNDRLSIIEDWKK
ncbi:uncharacterized protein [Fopius arisanus]|uniref:Uncharacterized protein n=1 Tax=Fopius arisanus TaxID=64838 RepID=A0A9R1TZD5_9HYME|nr:PREDICTED: uncharacterized protein LOC105265871 [Fopius arisanus]